MTAHLELPSPTQTAGAQDVRASVRNERWREAGAALMEGLSGVTLPGLLAAGTVAVAQFALLACWITPDFVARVDEGYLVYSPIDDFAMVTKVALKIERSDPETLQLVFAGPSTTRESVLDDRRMEADLERLVGEPVRFWLAASSWQSFWETAAVVDHLPEGYRGAVLIGITPGRLSRSVDFLARLLDKPQMALDSPSFDREVELAGLPVPEKTGIYLWDHARFFAARRAALWRLLRGPMPYHRNRYADRPRWTDAHWQQWESEVASRWGANMQKCKDANLAVLDRILNRLDAQGIPSALVHTPMDEARLMAVGPDWYPVYINAVQRYAAQRGVPFWDLNEQVGVTTDDFFDWGHFRRRKTQLRYQAALAQKVGPLLQKCARATP